MPEEKLELSSSGLKLSYLRFLADGAAGLIVELLLFIGYYTVWLPDHPVYSIGKEVKVYLLILAVFLIIPIGLFLNAMGWFLFGGIQAWGAGFWFRRHRCVIVRATSNNYSFDRVVSAYGIAVGSSNQEPSGETDKEFGKEVDKEPGTCRYTAKDFYELSQFHEDATRIFHGYLAENTPHAKGIQRLIRSLLLILPTSVFFFWPRLRDEISFWKVFSLIVAWFILLSVLTLLEYYQRLGALQKAYIISLDESVVSEHDAVLKRLVRGGLPGRSHGDAGTEP